MKKSDERNTLDSAWNQAREDEWVFIIREDDVNAEHLIQLWINAEISSKKKTKNDLEIVRANKMLSRLKTKAINAQWVKNAIIRPFSSFEGVYVIESTPEDRKVPFLYNKAMKNWATTGTIYTSVLEAAAELHELQKIAGLVKPTQENLVVMPAAATLSLAAANDVRDGGRDAAESLISKEAKNYK